MCICFFFSYRGRSKLQISHKLLFRYTILKEEYSLGTANYLILHAPRSLFKSRQSFALVQLESCSVLMTFLFPANSYSIMIKKTNIRIYNPTKNFLGLSLDETDHVIKKSDDGYQTIFAVRFDVRRLILFRRNKGLETSKCSS